MSWRNIGVVYRKELTDSLRDRRTVISMIVVPILLMPLLTILRRSFLGSAHRPGHAGSALGHGRRSGRLAANAGRPARPERRLASCRPQPDYAQQIVDKQIRAAVEIPSGF